MPCFCHFLLLLLPCVYSQASTGNKADSSTLTFDNMNPQKCSFRDLVVLLCFSLSFAHMVPDHDTQSHENDKKNQDLNHMINPTGAGAGMGFGWLNPVPPYGPCLGPECHASSFPFPVPRTPIFGPKPGLLPPNLPVPGFGFVPKPAFPPQLPIVGPGPDYGYNQPGTGCPCTVQCYYQYKMKLRQLRKAKRLRINELQNSEADEDLTKSGGRDDSVGSLGQLYPQHVVDDMTDP